MSKTFIIKITLEDERYCNGCKYLCDCIRTLEIIGTKFLPYKRPESCPLIEEVSDE